MCLQQANNAFVHSFIHCFYVTYLVPNTCPAGHQELKILKWIKQGVYPQGAQNSKEDKQQSVRDMCSSTTELNTPWKKNLLIGGHEPICLALLCTWKQRYHKSREKTKSMKKSAVELTKEYSGYPSRCSFISEHVPWDKEGLSRSKRPILKHKECGSGKRNKTDSGQIVKTHFNIGNVELFWKYYFSNSRYNFLLLVSRGFFILGGRIFHHPLLKRTLLKGETTIISPLPWLIPLLLCQGSPKGCQLMTIVMVFWDVDTCLPQTGLRPPTHFT